MSKCQVKYNSLGSIDSVLNEQGKPSQLYVDIAKHPFVESKEKALNIYKNIYTQKVDENSSFIHKTKYGFTNSLKEALDESNEGDVIEVGFYGKEFVKIMSINVNTDPNTVEGFVNLQIKNGLLSEDKIIDPDGTFFKAKGESSQAKAINTALLEEQLKQHVGIGGYKRHKGNKYTIDSIKPKYNYSQGTIDAILSEELAKSSMMRTFGKDKIDESEGLNEDELKIRLLNLLNSLGIKVTSISEYISKYNAKNGVDPSANALADIAGKVIAFQNGEIGVEDLTEEVSHFIVEGFPQDQIENLLRNIHKTDEWNEYSKNYREVYAKEYSGENLEQAVRREVLGKVLANSLQAKFQTEKASGTQLSVIEKLRDLFDTLMKRVQEFLTPQHSIDIAAFTKQVKDLLMKDELSNYISQDNFAANKFRFYSTNSTDSNPINQIRSRAIAAIEVLKRQIADLSKTSQASGVSRQQLRQALDDLDKESTTQSITTLLEVTRKQIDYIQNALKSNSKDEFVLSQEEVAVYESLKNDLNPILSELRERVRSKPATTDRAEWKAIEDRLTSALDSINKIEGIEKSNTSEVLDKLVDKVIERHNLDPVKYKDYIKTWFETAKSDTSYFHATFGQMIHAQDPLLSLAGVVIQDTMNEARIKYLKYTKEFQKELKDLNIKEKDLDQFFDNGFLTDAVDHHKFQEDILTIRMKALKEATKSDLTIEELIRRSKSPSREAKDSLPEVSPSQEAELNKTVSEEQNKITERVMLDKYYTEKEEKYKTAGVSPITISTLRAISQTRGSILQNARRSDGIVDRTLLSDSDNKRLDELGRDRKLQKNPYDTSGKLKKGLVPNPNASEDYAPAFILDPKEKQPSNEAVISADLQNLDSTYMKEEAAKAEKEGRKIKSIPQTFFNDLEAAQAESHEAALNFLRLNANMSFTPEFWDSFGENMSVNDRLEEVIQEGDPEISREASKVQSSIKDLSSRRKNLIKVYQNPNNPSEIDVEYMDKGVREEVKNLTEDLSTEYQKAFRLLEDIDNESEAVSESTVNEAYKNALKDRNIEDAAEEADFIKEHVTKSDLLRISQLEAFLKDYKKGLKDNVPLVLKNYVEANVELSDFDTNIEIRNYAKTKLLPYYKRLAPIGHQSLMSELNSGSKSVVDFVREVENNEHQIQVNPNYSYFQQGEDMVNPLYKTDYEGGYLQPKFNTYKNSKFEDMFAPEKKVDGSFTTYKDEKGNDVYRPTKNKNLYKGYEVLKQFQRANLEQIGELGSHSLYKLPQISKTRLEKITSFAENASSERLGEAWKDFSMYRVDEMERGAEFDGQTLSNSKIIPKYFLRDLESADDVSSQLFSTYAAFAQQAYLHRARRNNIGDMFALREKILNRKMNSGTPAEGSRTYKMFESYMDANYFGITEQSKLSINVLGREVDLTKLARRFLNFIKFKNLGFSAIVPATSWLTAEVNTKIEQWVQEHTNVRSGDMAFKEFKKLAPDAAKEFLNLNSEAKLSVLGEFMGIFDLENRYKNSSYNKTVRGGWKLGMGVHQMANFPIIPRLMLSVLYDNRVVDGNIVNFNDYVRQQKKDNPEITTKEIESEWSKFEDKNIYDYLTISKTGVEWQKDRISKDLGKEGEELDKFLENKLNGIQSRVEEVSSNIDGSISQYRQVAASRHYLLNYFMTHRNWLTIATSRRFKLGQTNLQTGEQEVGSWVSTYNFIGDYLKELSPKKNKEYRESLKTQWANSDETQRRNLKRVGIDIAVLNIMVLIGFIIANYADDDDNEDLWALQMGNYLYHRTLNETASSSLALPLQYMETIESPFVGLNVVQELGNLYKVFNFEDVKAGKYRGMTVGQRQLVKTVPGVKQMREIYNPKEASDTYRYYNRSNFNAIPATHFITED